MSTIACPRAPCQAREGTRDRVCLHRRMQRHMGLRCMVAVCMALMTFWASADTAPAEITGLYNAVFTEYSPLSTNTELARRLLTPLNAARIPQLLARAGKELSEQPVRLSDEKFVVYVPERAPPHGYALLVFVAPWPQATLPRGWAAVLDRFGVIFVSAAGAGNEASSLDRREPLALIAAHNIIRRYAVDMEHVYVGGFSGGSRIAMRLALGYPDIFRGALLNAGSDPIGSAEIPLPPRDLLVRFQSSSRLVYVTGEEDLPRLDMDVQSIHSMREWCVFDVDTQITRRMAHEVATPGALSAALRALLNPAGPDPRRLAGCRAGIEKRLAAQLQQVDSLTAGGQRDNAQKLLHEIDARFGGLAAPRSLELEKH